MTDLAAWLLDAIAEDEARADVATRLGESRWKAVGGSVELATVPRGSSIFEWMVAFDEGSPSEGQAVHIATWDPARVLAECAAKRALVEETMERSAEHRGPAATWVSLILGHLAQPYRDREGWRDEWAVS